MGKGTSLGVLLIALLATAVAYAAIIQPTFDKPVQLGVGGTTFSISQGETKRFIFYHPGTGDLKMSFTLENYVGIIRAEIRDEAGNVLAYNEGQAPLTVEYVTNVGGRYFIYVTLKSSTNPTTSVSIKWTVYQRGLFGWVDYNLGKQPDRPITIVYYRLTAQPRIATELYGVEGRFGGENEHWYLYCVDQNSYWNVPYSFFVSITGASGTDFDIYVYDLQGNEVARATGTSYPDYVLVRDPQLYCFKIKVYKYSGGSINEYRLIAGRPYVVDVSLSASNVKPGDTITVTFRYFNPFNHGLRIWQGFTIRARDNANEFYHIPAQLFTLGAGPGVVQYSFQITIPRDARLTTYDLLLGLWGDYNRTKDVMLYNLDYLEKSGAIVLSVPQNPYITYVSVSPTQVAPGDAVTVTVKWIFYKRSPGGDYVCGMAFGDWDKTRGVKFYDGRDGNYGVEQTATFSMSLPNDIYTGTHYIRVGFNYGSCPTSYDNIAVYKDVSFTVRKIDTWLALSPRNPTITGGQSITFTAQLLDSSGNPISNRKVTWTTSSSALSCTPIQEYTDQAGYAYARCTASMVTAATTVQVTASFGGDYRYNPSSASTTVTINPATYSVTVDPNGGRIYVDGTPITSRQTFQWTYGSQHTLDPDSPYYLSQDVRLVFTQWSDGSTADPRTVTVTGNAEYKALWKRQYKVSIVVEPQGSGTTSPAPGVYWYDENALIQIVATASGNYVFDHWEVNGVNMGSSPSLTLTVDKAYTIKAVFSQSLSVFYLVVRGLDGRVWWRQCSGVLCGVWSSVQEGFTDEAPGAVVVGGRLWLVVRGLNNGLYFGYVDLATGGFSGWQPIPGGTYFRPALATDGSRLWLVVTGFDGRVWVNKYDVATGQWGTWQPVPVGSTNAAPAAAYYAGRLYIAVRGTNGVIYYATTSDGASFSSWSPLGGSTPSAPYLTSDGTSLYLVVRGDDNRIWVSRYSGSWSSWEAIPGGYADEAPAAVAVGGRLYVAVKGLGNVAIWITYKDTQWNTWNPLDGGTNKPITLTQQT